jgi:hypothetical protein
MWMAFVWDGKKRRLKKMGKIGIGIGNQWGREKRNAACCLN